MSYRHLHHAGNFGDVLKHLLLYLTLEFLTEKDAPLRVIDTHAGGGLYDLESVPAQKAGAAAQGIARLLGAAGAPAALGGFVALVRGMNAGQAAPRWYPGSPSLVHALLRAHDHLDCFELQREAAAQLVNHFADDRRVKVYTEDGYSALRDKLPPPEHRGVVLIDPPYENQDEFPAALRALKEGYRRWPTGSYALWYPINERNTLEDFLHAVKSSGIREVLRVELSVRGGGKPAQMNGSGMLLVNPPWQLPQTLTEVLPWLSATLAQDPGAGWCCEWLVPA